MDGFVPTLANFYAAPNVFEDVPDEAVPVLQSVVASNPFGPTSKLQNCFVLASRKEWT